MIDAVCAICNSYGYDDDYDDGYVDDDAEDEDNETVHPSSLQNSKIQV